MAVHSSVGVGVGRVIPLDFRVLEQHMSTPVEVLHLREGGWGGRFVGLSERERALLRSFSDNTPASTAPIALPTRERILEQGRVHGVLRALIGDEAIGQVRGPGGEVLPIRPVELVTGPELTLLRCELEPDAALEPPFFLEVTGYNSRYWFPILDGDTVGGAFWARISDGFVRSRRRRSARLSGELGLLGTFVNPVTNVWAQGQVVDLSRTGLRVRWEEDGAAPSPGDRLDGVAIRGAESPVVIDALVRSSRSDGHQHTIGLEVIQAPGQGAWGRLVASLLHPTTRAHSADPGDLWALMVDSGYLELSGKRPGRFESQRAAFCEVSGRLSGAPELGAQIVWPAAGKPEASMSILRIYGDTWIGYQLAKRPGRHLLGIPRRRILRDLLIHCYEHAVAESPAGWFVAQFQDDASIGRLTQHAFAQRQIARDQTCIWPFRAWEIQVEDPIPRPREALEVSGATRGELEALCLQIADSRPAAFVAALELTLGGMSLQDTRAAWAAQGLCRERAVLVARRAGVPWAAAVIESGSDGLHLFRLLDVVRIFPMMGGSGDAIEALLEVCQLWYADRGKDSFIYLDEAPGAPDSAALQAIGDDLGGGDTTVIASAVVPDLIEHVFEVLAERSA